MSKYAIYYSPKSTPGPVGFFLLRLYKEDDHSFEGIMYDKDWSHKFGEGRYSVSKLLKHHIFEAENDENAILFFETMYSEIEYIHIQERSHIQKHV